MNKRLMLICISLFIHFSSDAHLEHVHQYIVGQAYLFLENEFCTLPGIKSSIFKPTGEPFHGFVDNDPDFPWKTDYGIAIGAWREDIDDPVFNFGSPLSGFTSSITHFWDADKGDNDTYSMGGASNVNNAWQKAQIYLFGGQKLFFSGKRKIDGELTQGLYYSYNSLIEFWKTGKCYFHGFVTSEGDKVILGTPEEVNMDLLTAQRWSYQILGRIAHLLGDMSVPAHVHLDKHPCPLGEGDRFELSMGGSDGMTNCGGDENVFPAQSYTAQTAKIQGNLIQEVTNYIDIAKL